MNDGWVFGDGQEYAATEEAALKIAKEWGFFDLQEAYDNDSAYWTEWEDEDDYQYAEVNGELIEVQ